MAKQHELPAPHSKTPPGVPPEGHVGPAPDETKPPPFGTAKPAEATGPLPRVVDELERAVPGTKRFKIRCNNYQPQERRYILARNEDEARACYTKVNKLDEEMERLKKNGGTVEPAALVVTLLPD